MLLIVSYRELGLGPLILALGCGPAAQSDPATDSTDGTTGGSGPATQGSTVTSGGPSGTSSTSSDSGETTQTSAVTGSEGTTGGLRQCGGEFQITATHGVDVGDWPGVDLGGITTWVVDADCLVADWYATDVSNFVLTCDHPAIGPVDLVLSTACWAGCPVPLEVGEPVHLVHQHDAAFEDAWTAVRDSSGALLFVGISAHALQFPDHPDAFSPLRLERLGPGLCPPSPLDCAGDPIPIEIRVGAETALVFDSYDARFSLGGVTYDVDVDSSCSPDPGSYYAQLIIIPV